MQSAAIMSLISDIVDENYRGDKAPLPEHTD